jgi:hypothetical protein
MTQPTPTKTRTPSMKWINLGSGKDPEFDKELFLTDSKMCYTGFLVKIEQTEQGKAFSFEVGNDSGGNVIVSTLMTHYCYTVLPNN